MLPRSWNRSPGAHELCRLRRRRVAELTKHRVYRRRRASRDSTLYGYRRAFAIYRAQAEVQGKTIAKGDGQYRDRQIQIDILVDTQTERSQQVKWLFLLPKSLCLLFMSILSVPGDGGLRIPVVSPSSFTRRGFPLDMYCVLRRRARLPPPHALGLYAGMAPQFILAFHLLRACLSSQHSPVAKVVRIS